jgi:photosystem II stability/assembly factor-like uncharacterized protein
MGGRTVDIDVVEKEPWIIYAAVGPSGVWKSENNGITWEPVFHRQSSVSAGDVTISQSFPDIVWVGTGEATCRNSVTIGDGVYKSVDAGKTWQHMGLTETRHISRIVINPGDPNIVYVGAMGHLWGSNEERGVYKTLDGGKTWKKVLYVDENTGIADLAMDPSNSQVLYAAAYEHRRLAYHFTSGGPGSGLFKSEDGGETWKKLTHDLPEGILGRIGIAVSRSSPNVVYALIEHNEPGIWRSEDKGETWKRTCDPEIFRRVNTRPFYYSQIRVDPSDDKRIYVFSSGSYVSEDMGKRFRAISGGTHPDHHALWIDPNNPLHLIDGNDGGIDITYDRGKNWNGIQHMALAEVYQIGFDMRKPYYVYCGLQDNGLWGGPSSTVEAKGILNEDWYVVGTGDGFYAQVDPSDHNIVYGNYQVNGIYRYDLKTGTTQTVRPVVSMDETPYRFNWNSPIHISPHDPKSVYTGGNFLFKTRNGGLSWEIISPDLSTNNPEKIKDSGGPITADNTGAEVHCTIITIAESPVKEGIIWCGTDDGNVQVTRDGGKNWANVSGNIQGLPPFTWCSRIEASHFDEGTAYAAFDGHRMDDYNTYLYKTEDFGRTWRSISGNLPFGWIHVVREDLRNRNLLFAGMEFGIYASLDGGGNWFSLMNNLPTVAVRDIAIHPRENDLIIGTHGRGVWIMDDISPLQEMTEDVKTKDMFFFSIRPSTQFFFSTAKESYSRPIYAAPNAPYGMILNAYFANKPEKIPEIRIQDDSGNDIFKVKLKKRAGLQRTYWGLQYTPKDEEGEEMKTSGAGMIAPLFAPPGEYHLVFQMGDKTIAQKGAVERDPRMEVPEDVWQKQKDAMVRIMKVNRAMGLSITTVRSLRRQLDNLDKKLGENEDVPEEVLQARSTFMTVFEPLEKDLMPTGFGADRTLDDVLRGGPMAQRILMTAMRIGGVPWEPTEADLLQIEEFHKLVRNRVEKLNNLISKELGELNTLLASVKMNRIRAREVKY